MTPHQYALDYIGRGWFVFPLKPRSKEPATKNGLNDASNDSYQLDDWFNANHRYGVGLNLGLSGLFAVDVDLPRPSAPMDGREVLRDIEAEYEALPDTLTAHTPSGGTHYIFRQPQHCEIRSGSLGPSVDIKGAGGYIVLAPSIHPDTGTEYVWDLELGPDEQEPVDAPTWLVELLNKPRVSTIATLRTDDPLDNAVADRWSWGDLLRANGAQLAGPQRSNRDGQPVEMWTRPGKEDGVSGTVNWKGDGRLHVFSPNWPGLQQHSSYTPVQFIIATQHGGDFARGTARLSEQVGTRAPTPTADDLIDFSAPRALETQASIAEDTATEEEHGWESIEWPPLMSNPDAWPRPEILEITE